MPAGASLATLAGRRDSGRGRMARMIPVAACAVLLLCLPQAQDEAKALAAFRRAFAPPAKGTLSDPDARTRALAALEGLESLSVAKAYVDAHLQLEAEIASVEQDRARISEQIAKVLEGQERSERRDLPNQKNLLYHDLKLQADRLRKALDDQQALGEALRARVDRLQSRDTVAWLLANVQRDRRQALSLKVAIARRAASLVPPMAVELGKALEVARANDELIPALIGIGALGKQGAQMLDPVLHLLGHKEEAVRVEAASALARMAQGRAILPLIDLLEVERGQAAVAVSRALETITSQRHGTSVSTWRAWFKAEGARFVSGAEPLGRGRPGERRSASGGTSSYFDIPQDGKGIVYVIDCSGSMQREIQLRTGQTTAGGEVPTTTRMEACKAELIRALGSLETGKAFNIVWFNDMVHAWQPRMVKSDTATVAAAQAWVRELGPSSSTNIHDAVQRAFAFVGRGASDRYYGTEVDTIFLLTDGSPTRPDNSPDSTDAILVSVRQWNALKRVVIHCIAIGKELNAGFLRQLADENGGEYRAY